MYTHPKSIIENPRPKLITTVKELKFPEDFVNKIICGDAVEIMKKYLMEKLI